MDVTEINAKTGEVTKRDYTPKELGQRKVDVASEKEITTAQETEDNDRRTIIEASRTLALSLGFTPAMLAVMYPQLEEPLSE